MHFLRLLRLQQLWLVALVIGLAAGAHFGGLLQPLHQSLADLRSRAWERPVSGEILLVDIDAKSLAAVGVWPWPRAIHAAITDRLAGAGARLIAFDVDFSSASDPGNDGAFAKALERAGGATLLAAFNQVLTGANAETRLAANLPIPELAAHSWPAHVNVIGDRRNLVREIATSSKIGSQQVPAMAAMLAARSGKLGPRLTIDYSIQPSSFDVVSAIDLLQGRVSASVITNRAVLVGASALELRDIFPVPVHGILSGPVIQALAAETIIQNRALQPLDGWPLAALGLLAAAAGFAWIRALDWHAVLAGLASISLSVEVAAAALQAVSPWVLDTSAVQAACAGLAVAVVMREIYQRRILLARSHEQTRNTRAILDRVVADNFAGVMVMDGGGIVRAMSRRASEILKCSDLTGQPVSGCGMPDLCRVIEEGLAARAGTDGACEMLHQDGGETRRLEYVLTLSHLDTDAREQSSGELIACLTFRDVTEERATQERLAYLARNDVLTGLPNRHAFSEALQAALDQRPEEVALFFFDLDRFKLINDTLGHAVGDALLCAVGQRASEVASKRGLATRFGGDEFAIFVNSARPEDLIPMGRELNETLSKPYMLEEHRLVVGASIGCVAGSAASSPEQMIKNADTALYRAKALGGDSVVVFDESMDARQRERQALEQDLWRAFEQWQFELAYQPQVELATGRITGLEVLLRWPHPVRGYVSPADFVPVAEAIGLIGQLGRRVLIDACREAACWPSDVKVSVNVSPGQFSRSNLVQDVEDALRLSGLPAERLDLEITESLFIYDHAAIAAAMCELRARGVSFSIDDFGTGYSSLSYLRKFPVDKIKIDRSFVIGLPTNGDSLAIVSAVRAIANTMNLRVNAEGVETAEQADALRMLGCDEGQGWLFGRPLTAGQLVASLESQQTAAA